jgi:hypothetical protein
MFNPTSAVEFYSNATVLDVRAFTLPARRAVEKQQNIFFFGIMAVCIQLLLLHAATY